MVRSIVGAVLFCALIVCFAAVPASANSGELLSLKGPGNLQTVDSFNNGGGLSSTPNYGVTFSSNFYGFISIANGGADTVLAMIQLANLNKGCTSSAYCTWGSRGVDFAGSAHLVTLSGPGNEPRVPDAILGSNTIALPEPSSIYLFASGLTFISVSRLRRFLGL